MQSKVDNPLRNLAEPAYIINIQGPTQNYPVKYDADLNDPNNLSENPP